MLREQLIKCIYPTLRAIAVTDNQWRARERLFMDGGSGGWSVTIGRWLGLIEPKGRLGYCVVGGNHDMVKLTDEGVRVERALRERLSADKPPQC